MFQSGVFMSSQKYQGLLDQVNRQKLAIDNEKVSDGEIRVKHGFHHHGHHRALVAPPLTVAEIFCGASPCHLSTSVRHHRGHHNRRRRVEIIHFGF